MTTDAEIHRRQWVPGLEVTLQVNVQRRSKRTGWRLHPLFVKNVLQKTWRQMLLCATCLAKILTVSVWCLRCQTPNLINSFKCVSACETKQPSTLWLGNVTWWLHVTFLSIKHWTFVGRQGKKLIVLLQKLQIFMWCCPKKKRKNSVDRSWTGLHEYEIRF